MASNKKVVERLDRSSSIKIGIIRGLIRAPEFAKDRVFCQNWLCFLAEAGKTQPGPCSGLLEYMERHLREFGQLSAPFTTHVYGRTDPRVLLDEARQLDPRPLETVAPQTPESSLSSGSSFVWRQRVMHFSALEEQYRRKTVEQRLASKPKKAAAIQDIGVQVEPPVLACRLPKKQEQDNCQRVAETRQLDLKRKTEAQQIREQRLLEQRLKVQEQREHERKIMNKKRDALRQKPDEAKVDPVSRGRAKEPLQKPGKQVKKAPLPSAGKINDRQAALRAEIARQKETAYEEVKQYHRKRALEERVHLKERLDREKAEQEQKAKQGRATGGQDELDGRTRQGKDTKRDQKKQEELQKKAHEENERRQREDLQERTQRQREAREESERRQREDLLRKMEERTQREREAREAQLRQMDDRLRNLEKQGIEQTKIVDLFAVRGKLLQQKQSQHREKYKRRPEGLTAAQVKEFREKEIKDLKELLEETTEHRNEARNAILEMTTRLGIERLLHKTQQQQLASQEVRPMSEEGEPTPDPCLRIQEEKDCLAKKIRERCETIETKLLPRAPNRDSNYWDSWAQELRGKCLKDLRDIEAALNQYPSATLEDEGLADAPNQIGDDPNQIGDDPNQTGDDPNQTGDDPNQTGDDPNQIGDDPNQIGDDPNQIGDDPNQIGDDPNQIGDDPNQIGDDPNRSHREVNDLAPRSSALPGASSLEPSAPSNPVHGAGEPRLYAGESVVSFCTITYRKRYSHINVRGRKPVSLHQRAFGQLLKGRGPTALEPGVLAGNNRILERKLAVAKTIALNKHIQKSLMQKAGRLIDVSVGEGLPRNFFQALLSPVLQGSEHVSPRVLADIAALDNQLEAYLGSLFEGQAVDLTHEQTVQQLRVLDNRPHLVSELTKGFCDQHPESREILLRIEQLYRIWKDQRLDRQ